MNDRLLVFKHLADLDGDLRLLIAVGQLAQVVGRRADADDRLHVQLRVHGALNALGQRADILRGLVRRHFLDDDNVRLAHAEHKSCCRSGNMFWISSSTAISVTFT